MRQLKFNDFPNVIWMLRACQCASHGWNFESSILHAHKFDNIFDGLKSFLCALSAWDVTHFGDNSLL